MKYYCDHCSYETDKKANYTRHLNRKFKCYNTNENIHANHENIHADHENIHANHENIHANHENIHANHENIHANHENIHDVCKAYKLYECSKCKKKFACKQNVLYHEERCQGFSKDTCEICLKTFASPRGKYQHKRNVLCFPAPPPPPPPPHALEDQRSENPLIVHGSTLPTTISNIQNNNQMTNSNNNNTINNNQMTNSNNNNTINNNQITNSNNNNTINNNIIHFNSFGDEGIKQLEEFFGEDKEIIERLKQVGKKQLYGIRDIQNDIFFNPKNPKGFSIIKPEKYGSGVRVRNSEGEFEYMEFEDVRDPMLNYIEKFINIYNKTRNKYNVKFRDPKERRILHTFLKIMNDDLDIYLNEDLKEDLDIKEEPNECENDDEDMKYKQFDKVSLDNMHVQTKKYFKCKKGEFVLKDNNV